MAILGLQLKRTKSEAAAEIEADRAMRARLASRLDQVDQTRRLQKFGAIRGVNRQHERKLAYRVATAMFSTETQESCRIVNQSHSGLRLAFNSDAECPDEFALTIPTLRFIGIVKKVWQEGREAGVTIVRWSDRD